MCVVDEGDNLIVVRIGDIVDVHGRGTVMVCCAVRGGGGGALRVARVGHDHRRRRQRLETVVQHFIVHIAWTRHHRLELGVLAAVRALARMAHGAALRVVAQSGTS